MRLFPNVYHRSRMENGYEMDSICNFIRWDSSMVCLLDKCFAHPHIFICCFWICSACYFCWMLGISCSSLARSRRQMTDKKPELVTETAARAIYEARNGRGCKAWNLLPGSHKDPYLADAKAAIDAYQDYIRRAPVENPTPVTKPNLTEH